MYAGYFVWYLGLVGTGLYFLYNSIGARAGLPSTLVWQFLWGAQLIAGFSLLLLPFAHLWILGHLR